VEEQQNRNDNFALQKFENIVFMWMVVAMTISGVILAGLQLLASFKLTKLGIIENTSVGKISFSHNSVAVQSSIVGVIILVISFGFFIVFVHDIYKITQVTEEVSSGAKTDSISNNVGQGQKK
jgi:hypothetical protein